MPLRGTTTDESNVRPWTRGTPGVGEIAASLCKEERMVNSQEFFMPPAAPGRMKIFPLNKEGGAKRQGVVRSAFRIPCITTPLRLRLLSPFFKGDFQRRQDEAHQISV